MNNFILKPGYTERLSTPAITIQSHEDESYEVTIKRFKSREFWIHKDFSNPERNLFVLTSRPKYPEDYIYVKEAVE